jgi:hypothetical protein
MRRTLAILGGLALATGFGQFPEYAQQYAQRLGGAVDELRIITAEFDAAATEAGLTRDEALTRYSLSGDEFLAERGASMARTFVRYEELSETQAEIRGATGWQRFSRLGAYFDSDIGRRALADFQPAVPITVEGFAYAGAGFVLGYVILSSILAVLMLPFRRRPRLARVAVHPAGD